MSRADAPGVDVLVETAEWTLAVPDAVDRAARAAEAALEAAGIAPAEVALTVLLADDIRVAALNAAFRGQPKPTNVLSWPSMAWDRPVAAEALTPQPFFLGDVALARETVTAEAEAGGRALEDHLAHLTIHGVLHLLGFDHQNEEDAEAMAAREGAALAAIGAPPLEGSAAPDGSGRGGSVASMEED